LQKLPGPNQPGAKCNYDWLLPDNNLEHHKKNIMKKLVTIFFLIAFQQFNYANDSLPGRKIIFSAKIKTDEKIIRGYLANINDTAVSLTLPLGTLPETQNISYAEISSLSLHRKGNGGRCALIGALTGVGIGAIAGLASGSDPEPHTLFGMTAGEKAVVYGFALGLTGTITGAIIGALTKKVFTINKNKENFHNMKTSILDKVYGARRSG
jgi:hypothetical protein